MNIEGLNMQEITLAIKDYIIEYFKSCILADMSDNIFCESNIFEFSEVEHLIPSKYHHIYNEEKFVGSCGNLNFQSKSVEFSDCDYIVMLLSNFDNSKILFLYVQEQNNLLNKQRDILIKDFIS